MAATAWALALLPLVADAACGTEAMAALAASTVPLPAWALFVPTRLLRGPATATLSQPMEDCADDLEVRGDRVGLRPVRPSDSELLAEWARSHVLGEFNDLGPHDEDLKAGLPASPLLVVTLAGCVPLGDVSWHLVRHGPNRKSRAWNMGINLVPSARGKGFGAEAQRLLAQHLFATTDVNRVEASTDVENVAEQRSLEKAGFSREGVLRQAQFRGGGWHDLYLYSRVRSDRS